MAASANYTPQDDGIHVLIGSYRIENIEGVQVTRSIETIPSNYSIALILKLPDGKTSAVDLIQTLDTVTIWSHKQIIHRGVVERKPRRLNSNSLEVVISGRSIIRNIFDCNAKNNGYNVTANSLIDLISQMISPLNIQGDIIDKRGDTSEQSLVGFNLNPGENVWPVISRAASYEGVLVYDSPQGDLIISKVDPSARPVARLDNNAPILDMSLVEDDSERFATYRVVLQPVALGNDNFSSMTFGLAQDDEILKKDPSRERLIINATMNASGDYSQRLADWTRNRTWARSRTLEVTVSGHAYAAGQIWDVEQMVQIDLPKLSIKDTWLISDVTYRYSRSEGETTLLSLMHPLGFTPEPIVIAGASAEQNISTSNTDN
ncbi:hypothetical protein HK22_02115 [Gluconobacter sp. DsW_056]|uniref:phage baseplate assembly protein n=1 Tax=Gluconobacter sp. DsW_056 TaxID=1511209 RepID=UPI000A3A1CD6|nr:hypothetical protein [Gluconobacter sp. DsW_056]OUI81674.1 hypothetical protein HK22_02115 [Gluconobacter sp. DsW_056]